MTIYDIAEEAGVSASMVSRVINNKSGVKKENVDKVRALLEKYNYSPNETARGLVNQTSKIIGILVADIRNIHYTDGAYIIEREFAKLGYCCIIFNTGTEEQTKAEYIEILSRRRVEGAVLIGSTFQTPNVESAIKQYLSDVPIVLANGYLDLPNVYGIMTDEEDGVSNCVRMLYGRGRENLAFIIDNQTPSNHLKQQGFEAAVRGLGLSEAPLICGAESSLDGAYKATVRLMEEHPEVNGIIYAVDLLAAGGVRALTDMGVKIPEQVAVLGIDNSIYCEISNPRISSLDNKLLELSMTAAKTLASVMEGEMAGKKMMIFSSITERETT